MILRFRARIIFILHVQYVRKIRKEFTIDRSTKRIRYSASPILNNHRTEDLIEPEEGLIVVFASIFDLSDRKLIASYPR